MWAQSYSVVKPHDADRMKHNFGLIKIIKVLGWALVFGGCVFLSLAGLGCMYYARRRQIWAEKKQSSSFTGYSAVEMTRKLSKQSMHTGRSRGGTSGAGPGSRSKSGTLRRTQSAMRPSSGVVDTDDMVLESPVAGTMPTVASMGGEGTMAVRHRARSDARPTRSRAHSRAMSSTTTIM